MQISFDISEDELPVFLAETSEHLQVLEEGLVKLERSENKPELIQALFRAAHTLKGAAGMIGHKRMVDLTHSLESALDEVRKDRIDISTDLIDICLETVDILRYLCDEVSTGLASQVEIEPLVQRFAAISHSSSKLADGSRNQPSIAPKMVLKENANVQSDTVSIYAEISRDSIASAARAFQLMLALQDLGEIQAMSPDLSQIETAAPVFEFTAELKPNKAKNPECLEEIQKSLVNISDVTRIIIEKDEYYQGKLVLQTPISAAPPSPEEPNRLGELLVKNGVISQAQLDEALKHQDMTKGPAGLIGHTLIKLGFTTQDVIDQVMAEKGRVKASSARTESAGPEEKGRGRAAEKTIRTSVERLDTLMNLVGELITDRNRLYQIRGEFENRFRGDNQVDTLAETITHVGRITDQLQAEVMGIRMLPVSNVFNKFPRLIRDLARKAGKQVELVIRGEDTELDRSVIEEISDPLIHLIRNSVDHGIETPADRLAAGKLERGAVLLTARHEQGRIFITVEDDGRGIDLERVKLKAIDKGLISEKEAAAMSQEEIIDLIFAPGLSTAKIISDVSGRGVGMDIVRNNIEHLNGHILVETWPGRGTQFQIVLPLTLAIVPTLLVKVGKGVFAIPLITVTETLRISEQDIQTINARPVILLRNHVLPVSNLSYVFNIHNAAERKRNKYVVVVRSGKSQMGLIVDTLIGEQEVVVKSLSSVVGDITGVSSAAILGDGQVALILDVQGLFKLATLHQHAYTRQEA